jgi:hypothetical protein
LSLSYNDGPIAVQTTIHSKDPANKHQDDRQKAHVVVMRKRRHWRKVIARVFVIAVR